MTDSGNNQGENEFNRAFFESCGLKDKNRADELLQEGADVNARNRIGQTALHKASRERDVERVVWLLERGADLDLTESWSGRTALHHASGGVGNLRLVELLCDHGADLDVTDAKGRTAMWEATFEGNYEVAYYLLIRGARDDLVPPNDGRSVLHLAAAPKGYMLEFYHPDMNLLERLVAYGADVNLPCTETGETPLHVACKVQDFEIVQLFMDASADVNAVNKKGESILFYALKYKSCTSNRIAEYLLESCGADPNVPSNDTGDYPLHLAVYDEDETNIKLLRHGARVDCQNKKGDTPLHVACVVGNAFLVEHGADVLAKNAEGQTPLHLLCKGDAYSRYSRLDTMQSLVEHGANVMAVDEEGRTPLHFACQSKYAHLDEVQYLVERGVNVLAKDAEGQTAFFRACGAGHIDIVYYFLRDHHWLVQLINR